MTTRTQEQILADLVANTGRAAQLRRKLAANQSVINYGVYFIYRTQQYDSASFYRQASPFGGSVVGPGGFVPRDAVAYVPDDVMAEMLKEFDKGDFYDYARPRPANPPGLGASGEVTVTDAPGARLNPAGN